MHPLGTPAALETPATLESPAAPEDPATPWQWPTTLDACLAAPDHHVLLFENEFVRILDISVLPGGIVPLHTHRWPATLYLLSWSDCLRRDAAGTILMDSRTAGRTAGTTPQTPVEGTIIWSPALPPHTLENVGTATLRILSTEIKTP